MEQEQRFGENNAANAPDPLSGLVLLVLEDDADMRGLLVEHFARVFGKVVGASCGKEAYALALSVKPDVLLSDIDLPDCVGGEVVNSLTSAGLLKGPALFLSSLVDSEESGISCFVNAGSQRYRAVSKNSGLGVLENAMRGVCEEYWKGECCNGIYC